MKPLVIDASVWVSAAGPGDGTSEPSQIFLSVVAKQRHPVALPEFAELEIACALSRRLRSPQQGRVFARRAAESPLVTTHPLSQALLQRAVAEGTERFLRAGDAIYAAVAEAVDGEIVSWDKELVNRAGAVTPEEWVARYAG